MCAHAERLGWKGLAVRKTPWLVQGWIPRREWDGGRRSSRAGTTFSVCGVGKTGLGWESQRAVKWKDEML